MIYSNSDYGVPKKKKINGFIIFLVLLVIVMGIGSFCYYKFIYSKNVFLVYIDNFFDYLNDSFNESYDSVSGNVDVKFNFVSEDEEENKVFNIFNKLDFSFDYGIDYDKSILNINLDSNYDDKTLLDGSLYTEYGRAYIYLDNLYDKYIEVSLDDYNSIFEKDTDDYNNIIIGLSNAVIDSLKDEYFSVEKDILNGKKVTKTILNLTGDSYKEYQDSMVKILVSDQKFLESYASVTKKSVEDIKKLIEDSKDEDSKGIRYVLYTSKLYFIKLEMDDFENKFVVERDGNEYKYDYYEGDIVVFNGSVKLKGNDKDNTVVFSYYDKENKVGMELSVNSKIDINKEIDRVDVSNFISSEKMSEDDYNSIYSKLLENDGIVKLVEEISNFSS